MGTGPEARSYWENRSSKARRTSVMTGQELLEHPIWTLYLEKGEGRAEKSQRRQRLAVGASLREDLSLLCRRVEVCVEKVQTAGSSPASCSVRIRGHWRERPSPTRSEWRWGVLENILLSVGPQGGHGLLGPAELPRGPLRGAGLPHVPGLMAPWQQCRGGNPRPQTSSRFPSTPRVRQDPSPRPWQGSGRHPSPDPLPLQGHPSEPFWAQ